MTDEKNPQQAKIHKGAPKRDPVSYQTTRDIIIPAGTLMRYADKGDNTFRCEVGFGDLVAEFSFEIKPGSVVGANTFKRVIAA